MCTRTPSSKVEAWLQLRHSWATAYGCSIGITENFRRTEKGTDHERVEAHEVSTHGDRRWVQQ